METDVPFFVSAPLVCENVSIAKFRPNIKTIQGVYSTIHQNQTVSLTYPTTYKMIVSRSHEKFPAIV